MLKEIKHKQVIIVGAGPVGMVLALLLNKAGINVKLVDKRDAATTLPRAIAINQATLSLFETLGLIEIFCRGLKVPFAQLYWRNKKLKQLDFKNSETAYPYFFHIQQSIIEEILENEIRKLGISYFRSTELTEIKQTNNQVTVTLNANGHSSQQQCDFLIGADGGQSKTRELIDSKIDVEQYGAHFMLADATFEDAFQFSSTHYHFTADGYAMLVPIANKQTRLIFSFKGMVSDKSWKKIAIQRLLNERVIDAPTIKGLIWTTQANFGHRLSQKVVDQHVVLAGDALHQFSPVGGTNMNIGLQDAAALSETLIAAFKTPKATMNLLNGYAADRKLVMQEQQEMTQWFTALMTRTKLYPDTKRYSLDDAEQQLLGYPTNSLTKNSQLSHFKKELIQC